MDKDSTRAAEQALFAGEAWFDPIEAGIRGRIRGLIEELVEQELRRRWGARGTSGRRGGERHRNGTRERRQLGSFGPVQSACRVPAWPSRGQHAGVAQRRAAPLRPADAPARGADRRCLPGGTNTRRVQRALGALFRGAVGKDVVSRAWRKVKADWDAWNRRDLAAEDMVRLILDGTVVRVRLDRKAIESRCWSCSACAATGRRCSWP